MPFDNTKAMRAVQFINLLKHVDGDWYGKPFDMMPWQTEVITNVYGTMTDEDIRQYQFAYLEIPKKNGKTELAAAVGVYHTFCDGEKHGEVYGCAAERSQASIAFDVAVEMIEQAPLLKKRCKFTASKKRLEDTVSKTFYQVLSAEAYSKHGYKPSCVIFDELHAQPNRDLWDIMTFGAGDARKQPLWFVITTAGNDPDRATIGYEVHEKAQKILSGEYIDPRWYCKIYGLPEGEDIWDEANWYKANPSLGLTIDITKVRQAAIGARNNEAEERLFRWLRLNQWISTKSEGWLPLTLWDTTIGTWNKSELVGKKCYMGLDLASVGDLAGKVLVFPPQEGIDGWRTMFKGYIPEDRMQERIKRDGVPFDRWVNAGHIVATQGNVIDYDYIKADVIADTELYNVTMICEDPWNAEMLNQEIKKSLEKRNKKIELVDIPQTMASLSPPMKEIERLLKTGEMTHEANPAARWCFGNVRTAVDGNGNIKPMKNKSKDKIDLTVAWIIAMAMAMKLEKKSIYEERGMRSL
jgi:phage terminase large subunit-like protein